MADQNVVLEHARSFLRSKPGSDEAALRAQLHEQLLLNEERGRAAALSPGASGGDAGGLALIFHIVLLPLFAFRWLSFRQRRRDLDTQIDAAIVILRKEGSLAPTAGDRSSDA